MELSQCNICFNIFCEENYLPKSLDCGHSLCLKCLKTILQTQKSCPTCRAPLSKSSEEYPTDFKVLYQNLKNNNNCIDVRKNYTFEDLKCNILAKKEILSDLLEERKLNTDTMKSNVADIQKMVGWIKDFEIEEAEAFALDINNHLDSVDQVLNCACNPKDKDLLRLKNYKNAKHFLYDISVRLQNDEKIYACQKICDIGWRYGNITCTEDKLHIHCLSEAEIERPSSLILLRDLQDCMSRKEDIILFIEFGDQKLRFTLNDDSFIDTLRCLTFCTGERGHTIKGLDSRVFEFGKKESENDLKPENLNTCCIQLPTKETGEGYEDALRQDKICKANEGEVVLQCGFNFIFIFKWPAGELSSVTSIIGKLHKNCQINFNEIKLENKITECGLSIQL